MTDGKLEGQLMHLSQMVSQTDNYLHSIKENIAGSSSYWNVHNSTIEDALKLADDTEKLLVPIIYWTENALDIHYAPMEEEKEQLIEASLKVAQSFSLLHDVFIREIYPVADTQWVVKVKNFLHLTNVYLGEVDSTVRSIGRN